ncbi:Site-specific DNA-methyltransferase (adenine-specific) [Crinalium epipsammum PCC 9333]|uniref:site-specific DNA-methyltransferase (adenine-specific) n=1 Tax=Crinalium epipsammum PCC 9333 TaxID=1173022 RepID=K9W3F5_9CYAN|nr:adenine-specific DNA-methyltransferase [Crinalium epipsammum]AFZ14888.1 Site-specific DNA-methyltransferase (adenine-specific) [Crinalium epipsammum PCC 9333]
MTITKANEEARAFLNQRLNEAKTQTERNKLGQFATPTTLASDIVKYAKTLLPSDIKINFLDPAFGTGCFYSALLQQFPISQVTKAVGYEIDPHYGDETIKLWKNTSLQLHITDFTQTTPPNSDQGKANLLICNPPYVRHHHLSRVEKVRLQLLTEQISGIKLSQLASFYCHFLCISDAWMAENCLAGWLIPSGFMDVNYGQQVKEYLLSRVTLLRIHRFDPIDVQFEDALVSSAVVWFKKAKPPANHIVEFTYGGSLTKPNISQIVLLKELREKTKWTRFGLVYNGNGSTSKSLKLSDLFTIKRGLATGANQFFILTPNQINSYQLPFEFLKPILPSPRVLSFDEIEADSEGNPLLNRKLFLLACDLPLSAVKIKYPSLWEYLQMGVEQGISDRYLCKHRSPWYAQEKRPPSPFLCTYMGRQSSGRGRPFRFILNHSMATATNVYLMLYPKPSVAKALSDKPELLKQVWQALNQISNEMLMGEGRVYGGGLHKLEPKELGNALAEKFIEVLPALLTD